MREDPEAVALEREVFVACYRALAEAAPQGAVRDDAGAFAFVTGLPLAMFNGCVVTTPDEPAGVARASAWLAEQGLPWTLWVPRDDAHRMDALAARHGLLKESRPLPGMVLRPVGARRPPPAGLVVEEARHGRESDFAQVVLRLGLGEDTAALLSAPSFAHRADVDLFVGYLDGAPVGTSVAVSSARATGVVNVLTLEEARGRGVGTALTWAAVQAGAARGHDTAVLQASPMGLAVYRAMGFRTVVEYVEYA